MIRVLVEASMPSPERSLSHSMALTDAVDDAMTMVEAGHDTGKYLQWLQTVHCRLLKCTPPKVHHQEILRKLEPFLLNHAPHALAPKETPRG